MNHKRIKERVDEVAARCLLENNYVRPLDILLGIGWLNPVHHDRWKKGEVPYLEKVIETNLGKISFAMQEFRRWANQRSLKPSETAYLSRSRGSVEPLQFSKSGDPTIELFYRTHYVSPELSEKKLEKLRNKLSQKPELVVYSVIRESSCGSCSIAIPSGGFLFVDKGQPLCLACGKMDHLVFLPSGDAGVTRKAKANSKIWAVVVRFSRARKRYERQGLLIDAIAVSMKAAQENEGVL